MLKFLILAVVFALIAYRIRRAVLVWRQLVADSIARAQRAAAGGAPAGAGAGRSELPAVELVTCSRCGDAVPRAKSVRSDPPSPTERTQLAGGWVCRDCHEVS